MINNMHIKKGGFTLVETLIAILVLSIAITGPLTIAQKGLQAALISKDQDTAFYLAQDAIEYIRYARDTNCLVASAAALAAHASDTSCQAQTGQWLAGTGSAPTVNLNPCVSANGMVACTVDVIAGSTPQSCISGVCSPILYDSGRNYYTYQNSDSTTAASIFTRTIVITSPGTNEADISVTVSWNDPIAHSITVKEDILDWQ